MMTDKNSKDALVDRLKAQEQAEAGRKANKDLPLMCRLDGRAFHTFTKGLTRPYDTRLSQLMVDTAAYLIEHTHAKLGYTQSDEITLCWWNKEDSEESLYMFDGKYQKLTSTLAAMASAYFNMRLETAIPEKAFSKTGQIQVFDARVWNVSYVEEVYLNFLWRQDDCIKNSISMAAQAKFSPKQLHGVGSEGKKDMLRKIGSPWENEPQFFRTGSFVQRVVKDVVLTNEQLVKIPEQYRPTGPVPRTIVQELDLGYIKDNAKMMEFFK